MSESLTRGDYVRWVQRSLNRITGSMMTCDGFETGPWREALRIFKSAQGIQEPGLTHYQIGAKTQNELVRLNDFNEEYVLWLRKHLKLAGSLDDPDAIDRMRAAIRGFQSRNGLKADGWVGPRTEATMVAVWGEKPPGHYDANSPRPGPPPRPVPEWLRNWRRLPPSQRYVRWTQDLADKVGGVEAHLHEPEYLWFCRVLANAAAEEPRRYYLYFSELSIQKIMMSNAPEVQSPGLEKLPDGRFTLPRRTIQTYQLMMASTRSLNMQLFFPTRTPDEYADRRATFEQDAKQTYLAIGRGISAWNWRWNNAGQALHDRLYVVRGMIEALMRVESHIYHAYAQQKSAKFDDLPGPMNIWIPWRWFDEVRL